MNYKQVVYVYEVAKHRNFSRAAESLYVTKPAITHQIKALEDELGVKLFIRESNKVGLTKDGEKFVELAKKTIEAFDDLMAAFDRGTEARKEIINVGVFPFYRAAGVGKVINMFFATHANVLGSITNLDNNAAYNMLKKGDLDMAVIKARPEYFREDYNYEVLLTERLVALASKNSPFGKKGKIDVGELYQMDLLTGTDDTSFFDEMRVLYEQNNMPFNISLIRTNEAEIMIEMIESGQGFNLITEKTAEHLANENMRIVEIEPPQIVKTAIAYPKDKKIRGIKRTFINEIADYYNSIEDYDDVAEQNIR